MATCCLHDRRPAAKASHAQLTGLGGMASAPCVRRHLCRQPFTADFSGKLIIATMAFGSILAWLRLGTGSVWPCVLAHAAWNSVINGGYTLATHNAPENIWVGETGIVVAGTLVLAAWVLGRTWKPADPHLR